MSVFGANQVGELIVGKTYAAEANMTDFITNAVDGDIQVLSGDSSAVAADKPFKILQKATAAAAGVEFTEIIDPKSINFIKAVNYVAPIARELKVTGFSGTVRNNVTYELWIRLYNDGGTLSPENFRMIPSFYVTPADASALTFTDVLTELKSQLEKTLSQESNNLFTIDILGAGGTEFSVTAGSREFVLGKKDGRPVEFSLQAAVRDNGSQSNQPGEFYPDLTVETVTEGNPGSGSGNQIANLEYCRQGEKYPRYRQIAYPANFDIPNYANPSSTYHVVTIGYFKERSYTNVEKQHRSLTIAVENADQDGAGAGTALTAVNALIADLATASGLTIPALV